MAHSSSILSSNQNISIQTVQNKRPYQEDRAVVVRGNAPDQFAASSDVQQNLITEASFADLQKKHGKERQGACAALATGWIDEQQNTAFIHTSYVGDCAVFAIGIADDKEPISMPCNPDLHDFDNEAEKQDVDARGGVIALGRLNANLSVYRAIGDNEHNGKGISHLPTMHKTRILLKEGYTYYMVLVTDGAMEHLKSKEAENKCVTFANELGKVFNALAKDGASCDVFAKAVIENALQLKSEDNVSVTVVRLTASAVTALMLDGHNGFDVAEDCANDINTCFKENLDNALSQEHALRAKVNAARALEDAMRERVRAQKLEEQAASCAATMTSSKYASSMDITVISSKYSDSASVPSVFTLESSISSISSSPAMNKNPSETSAITAITLLNEAHKKYFMDINRDQAGEELAKDANKQVIFRPSSETGSYISASIKLQDNTIQHCLFEFDGKLDQFVYLSDGDALDETVIPKDDLHAWCINHLAMRPVLNSVTSISLVNEPSFLRYLKETTAMSSTNNKYYESILSTMSVPSSLSTSSFSHFSQTHQSDTLENKKEEKREARESAQSSDTKEQGHPESSTNKN